MAYANYHVMIQENPQPIPEASAPMNRRNALLFVALMSLFTVTGFADEKPSSEREINALIAQLVSPNRAPDDKNGPDATYPVGYDRDAQKRVRRAWSQLHRLGHRAFPYLFDHFDDKRYSFTADDGPADMNWSVGLACSDILVCHLQPYGIRGQPSYAKHYNLRTSAGAKLWWETRKDKSLRELQIETLEWVIAEEARTPLRYSDQERLYLHDLLAKLRAGSVPLAPSVPWSR
jgi:hypothetical protein